MKPQIYHVDAFTSEPFRGNSAGVVLHADTLSDAQMQLIARELRHSETAFLLKSEESDVRIRYFTPTVEVPICGHATVAAHYVRATVLGLGNTTVWQTSLAGRHRVEIHAEHNDYRITLEQGQPSFEPPLVGEIRAAIITALNLTEDDIVPGAPIQVASTGHAKVMILLKPDVDIDALSPNLAALTAISQQIVCNGFFPFQIRPGKNETDGRMFSPAIGIVEDPVTGNANGPMGAWLVHHGLMAHDGKTLQIQGHQGRALGKEGRVLLMLPSPFAITSRKTSPSPARRSFCFMPNGPLLFNLCQARKSSRQKIIFPPPDGYQMQPLPRPAPPR